MHPTAILAIIAFAAGISANPVPANVDVPISNAEWQALRDGGLKARSAQSTVNQPISDAEWQALQDGGLSKREDAASIFKRDKVMNCGHKVTGKGGSNGHGKWIPVQQFSDVADTFCKKPHLSIKASLKIDKQDRKLKNSADLYKTKTGKAYVGTDIAKGHETSDTYPITLTNQDNASIPGPPGNIVCEYPLPTLLASAC